MSNFYRAMSQANILFGAEFNNEDDFAEIGLTAWNLIGNKRTKLYRYITDIDCDTLTVQLPCNAAIEDEGMIESVNLLGEDWNRTSNISDTGDYNSLITENYIEATKGSTYPMFTRGRYAKYEQSGDTLYFDRNYGKVFILYRGIIADEDGLPDLKESEVLAIATFAAYVQKYKEGLKTNNKELLQIAESLKREWLKRCDQARTDHYISQNEFNEILDAKTSWNRKSYGKSYHLHN